MPQRPRGEGERKDVHRDLLGSVRKREKHVPPREKGICLKEKWLYWRKMSYLMKLTNVKGNKLLSLQNVRKTVFRRYCYDLQLQLPFIDGHCSSLTRLLYPFCR